MTPYLYPAPPPSSPTGFGSRASTSCPASSFFSTLPNAAGPFHGDTQSTRDPDTFGLRHNYLSMRRNSLGLEGTQERSEDRMDQDSLPSSPTSRSPPLVPFTFPTSSAYSSMSTCPPSPPLVALNLPEPSSNQSSPFSSAFSFSPSRPVPHPLTTTSKLRLEMTPLSPGSHLALPDVEMTPPWSNLEACSLASPPLPPKQRKSSLVSLPVAPPTPPLTPNEELPSFDWRHVAAVEARGRSTEVTPLAKRRRFN